MITTSLIEGLTIIGLVTLMSLIVAPALLWVLPDRIHPTETKTLA